MDEIRNNVQAAMEHIRLAACRVGRDPRQVRLVAATKFVTAGQVLEAVKAGVTICGENRWQEAQAKMAAIGEERGLTWHFIGRLQRRKLKMLVGRFSLIHSVETVDQATELDHQADVMGMQQPILLEVNVGGESTKGGFSPLELMKALPAIDRLEHISVRGLMTIPPWEPDPEAVRPYFQQLRELGDQVTESSPIRIRMDELSMGMSHDYVIAVEEGATLVRIGTGIFGQRPR